jgi:hypothetical protein
MIADPYATRIPDGQYRAAFITLETGFAFGSRRWFGHFKITEHGKFFELPLLRVWNEPRGAFLPRSHNLALDFMAVIGTRPPSQGLEPSDFLKGCEVLVETATVRHQTQGRRRVELPEDCRYSKIDRLIRLTAGSPPCMSSRGARTSG